MKKKKGIWMPMRVAGKRPEMGCDEVVPGIGRKRMIIEKKRILGLL